MITPNIIRVTSLAAFAAGALFLSGLALNGQAQSAGPIPQANLGVTKIGSAEQVPPDSDISYNITVTNSGPNGAVNATLDDTLPGNMTFVSLVAPTGWTCSTPAPGSGGTISCSNPSLAPTAGEFFTLVGHVPPATPVGTIYTNTATVEATTSDPNTNNNSSSATTGVTEPNADLGVTKLASASQVPPDSDLTYTITVTNGGPSNAVNATMNDTLPGNMTFVSVSAPAGWTCSTPAPGAGGTVSCSNPSLAPNAGEIFTLVGHVPPGTPAGTIYNNTASVSTTSFDPNAENNTSSTSTSVTEPSADMGVTKLADANEVLAGSDVTFTIQVVNGGPNNAIDATLNDTLPGNMTFVSLSAPAGWTCSTPAPGSGGTISCSIPSLAPPGGDVFTLVGHIDAATPEGTVYTNTASVSSDLVDPNDKNDSSSVSTTVVACLTAPIVTTNANSGPGSLRQAILDACPDATITFDMTQVVSPITLTSGELLIDKNLTISGPGADLLAVVRATGGKTPSFRIFNVTGGTGGGSGVVTISGLTIANGFAQGKFPNSGGGGIANNSTGTVNVARCNLSE